MASTASIAERPDFAHVVAEHPQGAALAELCCDVLQRQSRTPSAGGGASRKLVKARARARGVTHRDAETVYGNVIDMLVRGAAPDAGTELVGAFTARGLQGWLTRQEAAYDAELEAFVKWLARQRDYRLFDVASAVLSHDALEQLAHLLQDACIRAEEHSRAEAVELLEALVRVDAHGEHLEALTAIFEDHVLEACADAMLGGRVSSPAPVPRHRVCVEGTWVSPRGTGPLRVLGWLTGWAVLRRVGVWLAWLMRWQSHARVSLDGRVVRVERWRSVLGRDVHVIDESLRVEEVLAVVRVLRRPLAVTVLGAACLLSGVTGFAVGIHQTVSRGDFLPVAWGLFALGFGAGCDLLLDYAARSRAGRVWIEITAPGRPALRIAGVDPEAAAHLTRGLDELR